MLPAYTQLDHGTVELNLNESTQVYLQSPTKSYNNESPENETAASTICSTCRNFFWQPNDWWFEKSERLEIDNIVDLARSVLQQCRLCQITWATVDLETLWSVHRNTYQTPPNLKNLTREQLRRRLLSSTSTTLVFDSAGGDWTLIPVKAITFPHMIQPMSANTSSDRAWACVKEWTTRCLNTHKKCGLERSGALPTRLIDVGASDAPCVRLVISGELEHRQQRIELLKENLNDLKDRIDWSSLSQTFQESIIVTRKLGFRYLWIDSLCIMQDCEIDWAKEAALMGKVYKQALYNIAATAASNGPGGLFCHREPIANSPFVIDIAREQDQQRYVGFKTSVRHEGLIKASLNRRGWVCQERLLSPRTIHFGAQLFWECKELEASESFPIGFPAGTETTDTSGDGMYYPYQLQNKSWLDDIKAKPESGYKIWRSIVNDYSCRKLTKGRDKLVAISGLAKEFQTVMDDDYVAGLWREDMINELAWRVPVHHQQPDRKPAEEYDSYLAPS
ncbi:HET-domain-containing protein [Microthyrium microscopicum]|uniref:HET-domain-containing protein n=1 Tax=Microthyrium microscopicum TaxID=703497 RepID=A0A6A6URA5_9PEZI|nr:HET-domain-containing protein [Microthyrium microscopicum]